jgi:hypothetical protein
MSQFEILKLIQDDFKNMPFSYYDLKKKVDLNDSSLYVNVRNLQKWGFITLLERVNDVTSCSAKSLYILSKKGEGVNL